MFALATWVGRFFMTQVGAQPGSWLCFPGGHGAPEFSLGGVGLTAVPAVHPTCSRIFPCCGALPPCPGAGLRTGAKPLGRAGPVLRSQAVGSGAPDFRPPPCLLLGAEAHGSAPFLYSPLLATRPVLLSHLLSQLKSRSLCHPW